MPSPFPGMDPYLEHPQLWPQVHVGLIGGIRDALGPRLRPRYYVAVEERVYRTPYEEPPATRRPDVLVARAAGAQAEEAVPEYRADGTNSPDGAQVVRVPVPVEVRHRYLEIRRAGSHEVVTVIEILSPANKRPGPARADYEEKRSAVLGSRVHFVEIDLLRAYGALPMSPEPRGAHYRILVSPAPERPRAYLYAFTVRQPIPEFSVPLDPDEPAPALRLGVLLQELYDTAAFDLQVDYTRPPEPALDGEDAAWACELVAAWRRQNPNPGCLGPS